MMGKRYVEILAHAVQLVAAKFRKCHARHAAAAQNIKIRPRHIVEVKTSKKNPHVKRCVMRSNHAAFQQWLDGRPQLAEGWCVLHIAVFNSVNSYIKWVKVIWIRFDQVMLCFDNCTAFHNGNPYAAGTCVSSVRCFEINC